MAVHRYAAWVNRRFPSSKKRGVLRLLFMMVYSLGAYLSVVTRKVQIEEDVPIGPGLWLSPRGGIIIGAKRIGANCVVHHNVTIGMSFATNKDEGLPTIGNNVTIEAQSLIYGDICLADGVVVKEGSVLTKSVPAGCIVQGNPGKIVRKSK